MSAVKAFSSISSPSWKSMARLVLPPRLELNRPEGSSSDAPLAKVIFTRSLYVSPVQIIPSWYHTGTPLHFHSSTTSGSACWMSFLMRASISPRQSPSSLILASISREGESVMFVEYAPASPRGHDPMRGIGVYQRRVELLYRMGQFVLGVMRDAVCFDQARGRGDGALGVGVQPVPDPAQPDAVYRQHSRLPLQRLLGGIQQRRVDPVHEAAEHVPRGGAKHRQNGDRDQQADDRVGQRAPHGPA